MAEQLKITSTKKVRLIEAPGQRIEVSQFLTGSDMVAIGRTWYYVLLMFWAVQLTEDITKLVRHVFG